MVGAASRGFDGGKKINGRKRHIAVDTPPAGDQPSRPRDGRARVSAR